MNVLNAVNVLLTLMSSFTTLATQVGQISDLIKKAKEEGRDTFTEAEWAVIVAADDAAKEELRKALA